jgi:hypothetical protein
MIQHDIAMVWMLTTAPRLLTTVVRLPTSASVSGLTIRLESFATTKPWQYWYVLKAELQLWQFMNGIKDWLVDTTIIEILSISTLEETFGPQPSEDVNALGMASSAMAVAAGFTAGVAPLAAAMGVVGGIMGLAAGAPAGDPIDTSAILHDQLLQVSDHVWNSDHAIANTRG